ncbi:MAG: LamG domain-containing protein [Bacteroidetes bacterium]|nr:LamG domain-containing protein [Bacteroidota bacterium]
MKYCILFLVAAGISITAVRAQGAGKALAFDGISAYVAIPHSAGIGLTQSFSMEMWVKTSAASGRVMDKYLNTRGALAYLSSGRVVFEHVGTSAIPVQSTSAIHDGNWHHVTWVVQAGGQQQVYIDGILEASVSVAANPADISNTVPLYLASNDGLNGFFPVTLDEVRLWNRALATDEIRRNMCQKLTGAEPGLAAYYRMDEGADGTCSPGGDVCDASGNDHHGIKF